MAQKPISEELENRAKITEQKSIQHKTEDTSDTSTLLCDKVDFQLLSDQAADGFFLLDLDGTIQDLNSGALDITGYKRKEMLSMNIGEIGLNIRPDEQGDLLLGTLNNRQPVKFISNIRCKDRSTVPVEVRLGSILAGKKKLLFIFIHDIREYKQAEEKIRESVKSFRTIMNNSPDAIFGCTEDGKLLIVNDSLSRSTGYTTDELLLMNFSEINSDILQKDSIRKQWEELSPGDRFLVNNSSHKRKNGSTFPVEVDLTKFRFDGSYIILGFARNITEQIKAEEENAKLGAQVQHAQRIESLGTLAGGIAHDFNNLLMGIQGNISLIMLETDASYPHFECFKSIGEYVQSGAELTKQLLGFAREGKYEVKATDLNELIKGHNRTFGRTQKEVIIRGKYEENIWAVEVDQRQIEQVLLNLYVNAWHAMPSGGNLYVQTENVTFDESNAMSMPYNMKPGRYVKISVTDTGVGMDEPTRQRIFEPFFTTKEMGRGTGLGLASVYGIINNHGGFIVVDSKKGEGTNFSIYLPPSKMKVAKETKSSKGEMLKGTETILLTDDEDMILEISAQMLAKLGYKVLTARSGEETITIYKKSMNNVDMVILDMIMPDVGGGETFNSLKEINPEIKVLLSSGYSVDGQAKGILDRGCNGFIQKPFNIKQLSRKVREVLEGK